MIVVISYMIIYHSELIIRKTTFNNQLHLFGMGHFEGLMEWVKPGNWKPSHKLQDKDEKDKSM